MPTNLIPISLVSSLLALWSVNAVSAKPASAPSVTAPSPAAKTPLGDLSPFRSIAVDALAVVQKGDFVAAKSRIKDLEVSWDKAEPKLKPLAPDRWEKVDAAIDKALKEVRAWRSNVISSSEALQALITTIDTLK